MRRSRRNTTARRLTTLATAAVCVTALAACAEDGTAKPAAKVDFKDGEGISATVLPQLAAPGKDVQASTEADFVVDATVEGAKAGRKVELQVADGDEWTVEDSAETDAKGQVSLTTGEAEELRVIAPGDKPVGINLSTADAPAETFVDEFDAQDTAAWATREQGYAGVRMCSKASDDAAQWVDGVVRLSVLDDPDKGDCTYKKDKFAYRLNGHIGSTFNFTYGHAAARVKFQELRGQHGAFWLQGLGTVPVGDPMDTGAEIDVIEYFGDDHPDGGLTSFIYWHPTAEGKMAGGWLKNPEQYGDDWSSKFHVFSVEWTPEKYVFRIDGQVTNTITEGISGRPEYLILSLLSSDYEIQHLGGDENLPQHMDVDWVKVWEPSKA